MALPGSRGPAHLHLDALVTVLHGVVRVVGTRYQVRPAVRVLVDGQPRRRVGELARQRVRDELRQQPGEPGRLHQVFQARVRVLDARSVQRLEIGVGVIDRRHDSGRRHAIGKDDRGVGLRDVGVRAFEVRRHEEGSLPCASPHRARDRRREKHALQATRLRWPK
jgi:hypothetical protein